MTRTNEPANDFEGGGFFNRLNRRLFPYLGPPPLGPYDQPAAQPAAGQACPLCGAPMSAHEFDRSDTTRPTKIYCPADLPTFAGSGAAQPAKAGTSGEVGDAS